MYIYIIVKPNLIIIQDSNLNPKKVGYKRIVELRTVLRELLQQRVGFHGLQCTLGNVIPGFLGGRLCHLFLGELFGVRFRIVAIVAPIAIRIPTATAKHRIP